MCYIGFFKPCVGWSGKIINTYYSISVEMANAKYGREFAFGKKKSKIDIVDSYLREDNKLSYNVIACESDNIFFTFIN